MSNQKRIGLYRKIHVALKQLPHMDDEAYRNLLRQEFGQESKKALRAHELARLADMLYRLGASYSPKDKGKGREKATRPDWIDIPASSPGAAQKRQICQIWRKLGYSMASLDVRVKRQFGVHTILWLHDQKDLATLLTDLQARERSFEAKAEA